MIGAAHVPVGTGWSPVGWYVVQPTETITVNLVENQDGSVRPESGPPITIFEDADQSNPTGEEDVADETAGFAPDELAARRPPAVERIRGRRIFDAAQTMPHIVGGIGAYYIHIEYPEEALMAGIEGRLMLSFIVEPDGRTSGIDVIRPLHPACDSAAVRALRQTRFVPGRQNGERVPVRMHLPVRFRLVDDEAPSATDGSS